MVEEFRLGPGSKDQPLEYPELVFQGLQEFQECQEFRGRQGLQDHQELQEFPEVEWFACTARPGVFPEGTVKLPVAEVESKPVADPRGVAEWSELSAVSESQPPAAEWCREVQRAAELSSPAVAEPWQSAEAEPGAAPPHHHWVEQSESVFPGAVVPRVLPEVEVAVVEPPQRALAAFSSRTSAPFDKLAKLPPGPKALSIELSQSKSGAGP